MKHLILVHFLQRLANLTENDKGSRFVIGLRKGRQVVEGTVLAKLQYQVHLFLSIEVIVNLLNPVGLADSIYFRKLENYSIFAL